MNKIKLGMVLLVVAALLAAAVYAESNKQVQPRKAKQKAAPVQLKDTAEPKQVAPAVPRVQVRPTDFPQTTPFKGSRQGYRLVTDVLDGFGGESESANYRIPVNSGGQPSAIGISESDTLVIEAGFVHAAKIRRGDVNADKVIDLGDIVHLLNYLFKGGPDPCPMEAGDANCDGIVDLGDVIYVLNYLYKGGPSPTC
jgi:hypothetical protein